MKVGGRIRDYDWVALAIVFAICATGLLMIWSATHNAHNLANLSMKQVEWIALGVAIMVALSFIDYHAIMEQAPVLYMLALVALIAVLAFGHTRFGAKRWLPIPGMGGAGQEGGFLQVSELVKLIIIIVLARFLSEVRTDRLLLGDLLKVGVLTGVPLALILKQPDLGTALVLVPVAAVGIYLAGIRWQHALAVLLLAGVMVPVAWHFMKPYQKERVTSFMRPEDDPKKSGYQVRQSQIAVGSGGFWGKGLGNGSQNQLGYIPVRYSDFILAALAEELGFKGVFFALLLYMVLLLRLVHNAQRAKDRAGMFLVMGVTAVLAFHVFVNVAMVIGYMPVTGIPLPLMSYGGSATLFVFMALGLVMNVRIRRFVN
jgi:rod shape determining protein RodA